MYQKGFCSGKFDFNWLLCHIGQQCSQMLYGHIFFSTESTSNQCILYFHLICSQKK